MPTQMHLSRSRLTARFHSIGRLTALFHCRTPTTTSASVLGSPALRSSLRERISARPVGSQPSLLLLLLLLLTCMPSPLQARAAATTSASTRATDQSCAASAPLARAWSMRALKKSITCRRDEQHVRAGETALNNTGTRKTTRAHTMCGNLRGRCTVRHADTTRQKHPQQKRPQLLTVKTLSVSSVNCG